MTQVQTPSLFRINIEVGDLAEAQRFYGELLGQTGRVQMGQRVYYQAGSVTLQVVQVADPHAAAKALYFITDAIDTMHHRALTLDCLSTERVHGESGGDPVVRPWGERSFYANDPWGNPLCFVEAGTVYEG